MSVPARTLAVLTGLVALVAALLGMPTAQADEPTTSDRPSVTKREAKAARALTRAESALAGEGGDATMALRDLALLKDALSPADRAVAERLAGRPVKASFVEGGNIRLHYTAAELTGSFDATYALNTMVSVSQAFSAGGYRQPKSDASSSDNGGNAKTDVYLDQLQPGLYGYCTTDDPNIGQGGKYDTWAFCVLDNDYAGFPANTPKENLQVTAAHEYYHAVQFAYDIGEDSWFMEATAAWAEDELYDAVDDNVQYLRSSPLSHPQRSMDKFGGSFHYGGWIFFRYLSEKFPQQTGQLPKVLLDMWKEADSSKGPNKDDYSVQAINKVLTQRELPLDKAFSLFSDANRRSRTYYDEGNSNKYPVKGLEGAKRLGKGQTKRFRATLDHLSSASYRYTPKNLGAKYKLKLKFDLAAKSRGSRAVVTTYKAGGGAKVKYVRLNGQGNATRKLGFSSSRVRAIEVTLVNASTRFNQCYQQSTPFSCSGKPVDQNVRGSVRGTVFKG